MILFVNNNSGVIFIKRPYLGVIRKPELLLQSTVILHVKGVSKIVRNI